LYETSGITCHVLPSRSASISGIFRGFQAIRNIRVFSNPWLNSPLPWFASFSSVCGSGSSTQIIPQGEVNQDKQPNKPSRNEEPGQSRAVAHVHEKEENQQHLYYGDSQGGDGVEAAEIELSDAPG